jgi:hypothetical protein
MKTCTSRGEIPNEAHYALIEFKSVCVDDGWDSKNNETYSVYNVCNDQKEWENEIKTRTLLVNSYGRDGFYAFKATPVVIETKINVSIK